eukprot:7038230-Pyramimonas_sp.AAC.1
MESRSQRGILGVAGFLRPLGPPLKLGQGRPRAGPAEKRVAVAPLAAAKSSLITGPSCLWSPAMTTL